MTREIVTGFEGEGLLIYSVKEAVLDEEHTVSLAHIERCYKGLADLVPELQSSECMIGHAFWKISDFDCGNDLCGVKSYIEKRLNKNDIRIIVGIKRLDICPTTYAKLLDCQPMSASAERSLSMLNKMLAKYRNFNPDNVRTYILLHYNSSCFIDFPKSISIC